VILATNIAETSLTIDGINIAESGVKTPKIKKIK
jgi:HrpA-like RNA helicase